MVPAGNQARSRTLTEKDTEEASGSRPQNKCSVLPLPPIAQCDYRDIEFTASAKTRSG